MTMGLCTIAAAHGGQYVPGPTTPPTVSAAGGTSGQTVGNGSYACNTGGGSGTGSIGGTIKTTFTWVKARDANNQEVANDLPPEKLIIVETCKVNMAANSYPASSTASASASNGLNPAFTTNDSGSGYLLGPYNSVRGTTAFANSEGTAARVHDGGQTIEVECSPTGSCTAPNGTYSVGISYGAAVHPISVSVAGSINPQPAKYKILIGQRATGALVCGVTGLTFTSYSWSVEGVLYRRWLRATDDSSAHPIGVPSSEWSTSSPSWRWKRFEIDPVDVSCTANVVYKGVSIGSATAKCGIVVDEPYWSFSHITGGVSTSFNANNFRIVQASKGGLPGLHFFGKVATPPPYWQQQGSSFWEFGQRIDVLRYVQRFSNPTFYTDAPGYQLDNVWPYGRGLPGFPPDGAHYSADPDPSTGEGTENNISDSPFQGIDSFSFYNCADNLEMYQMYKACDNGNGISSDPASDNTPIYLFNWSWTATDLRSSPNDPANSYPGSVDGSSFGNYDPAFPEWDTTFYNS